MFKKEKTVNGESVPSTATLTSHANYWASGFKYSFVYTDDGSTATDGVEGTFTVDTNREITIKSEMYPGSAPEPGEMWIDTSAENKGVVINTTEHFTVIEANASIFWMFVWG